MKAAQSHNGPEHVSSDTATSGAEPSAATDHALAVMDAAIVRIEELRMERDSARGEARDLRAALRDEQVLSAELFDALKGLEPFLDAIVCYASSMDEHEPNRIAVNARAAITKAGGQS